METSGRKYEWRRKGKSEEKNEGGTNKLEKKKKENKHILKTKKKT